MGTPVERVPPPPGTDGQGRRQRLGVGARTRWAGAALTVLLALEGRPGHAAGAQTSTDVVNLLDSLYDDSPEAQPTIDLFYEALERDDEVTVAVAAWQLAESLRNHGDVASAIELVGVVLDRYPSNPYYPVLLGVRGDLLRYAGRLNEALADLDSAAARAARPEYAVYRFFLFYIHSFRSQVLLDLGLLVPAQRSIQTMEELAERVVEDTLARGGEAAQAEAGRIRFSAAIRAYNLESAKWLHAAAEQRMLDLLEDPLVASVPGFGGPVHLRIGFMQVKLARDSLAGLTSRGHEELLDSAESELRRALTGVLTFEEELLAYLALADVAWLRGEGEDELEWLTVARAAAADEISAETGARLAAYEGRRLLRQRASADSLEAARARLEQAFLAVERDWLDVERPPEGLGFLHWDTQRLVVGVWIQLLIALEGPDAGAESALEVLHWDTQRLVVGVWIQLLIALGGPDAGAESALEVLMDVQGIGTLSQRIGGSASLAHTRASLGKGAGALVFLPSLDVSHVVAFDADGAVYAQLPSRRALQKLVDPVVRSVRRSPTSPESSADAQRAEDLARALLPARIRARMARWESVTFVGSGLLGDPCLESLPFGKASLGERFATSYLPSIGLIGTLFSRESGRELEELDLLVATGLPAPNALELMEGEPERLVALAGPSRVRFGERARLSPDLDGDVLAVIGHGVYDPSAHRPASIATHGGFTTCEALETAHLPPVVCLLSCGAARGPILRGDDGAVHLGGAALVGGAQTVLLARNEIETAASLALFELFVGALRGGASPGDALRRARVALPKLRPEWNHPFYTDSLQLFGLSRLP